MIWLVSFPRSGNTYLRILLKKVYGIESSEYHEDETLIKGELSDFKVLKTHFIKHKLPFLAPEDKVILLVRDGRDCMVSIAHHKKDIVQPSSNFKDNIREAIFSEKGSYFGGWSRNIESWINRADAVIRYEDLLLNPLNQLKRIESLLNCSPISDTSIPSFQELKIGGDKVDYGKGENRMNHPESGTKSYTKKFFRKGIKGSWEEEMNQEDQLLFWNIHGDTMRRLGYKKNGDITSPCSVLEFDLNQKLGLINEKKRSYKILIEANKLNDQGNDGIKRYQEELLNQMAKMNLNNSIWDISLYINQNVIPFEDYKNKLKEKEASQQVLLKNVLEEKKNSIIIEPTPETDLSEKTEVNVDTPFPKKNIQLTTPPLNERIGNWKKSLDARFFKNKTKLKQSFLIRVLKKSIHFLIILGLTFRDFLRLVFSKSKHYLIIIAQKINEFTLRPLKRLSLFIILNTIHYTIVGAQKINELFIRVIKGKAIASSQHGSNMAQLYSHKVKRKVKDKLNAINFSSRRKFSKFDLIHIPLPQNAIEFPRVSCPTVLTVHDFTHITHKEFHTKENIYNAQLGFDICTSRLKSHFISISDHTSEDIRKYLGEEQVFCKVSEAANNSLFHINPNYKELVRVKEKYKIVANRYILTLSTIEPRKNIISAIQAFNQYLKDTKDTDTKMVMLGKVGWDDTRFQDLKNEISKNPDRFIFTGFVDEEDLPILLNGGRTMLYLSLYEGFGLPILEAYKCGLPVICGNNSSQIEVAGESGLLVDPLNIEEIVHLLNKLINDDAFYRKTREKSMIHVENYSWYTAASETLAYFKQIIDES